MSLALLLDARWGQCPSCGEVHLWRKLREGHRVLWRTEHTTAKGDPCRYFMADWPTALGELVEVNPEAAS